MGHNRIGHSYRVVPIVGVERCSLSCFRLLVVQSELGEGQPSRPIILLVGYIGTKVLFHSGVHPFCLSVRFRMERRRHLRLHSQAYTQPLPEHTGKLSPSVRDYIVRKTVQPKDMRYKHVGHIGCGSGRPTQNKMTHLCQSIDYYPYGIESI